MRGGEDERGRRSEEEKLIITAEWRNIVSGKGHASYYQALKACLPAGRGETFQHRAAPCVKRHPHHIKPCKGGTESEKMRK